MTAPPSTAFPRTTFPRRADDGPARPHPTSTRSSRAPQVAVFGDGFGALGVAHYLLDVGLVPLVVPAPEPGRELIERRITDGIAVDAFPLPLRARDTAALALLHDLGLGARVIWRRASTHDLLGNAVPRLCRLRAEMADAVLRGLSAERQTLAARHAVPWMRRAAGATAFDQVLRPRLEAELGPIDDQLPADTARRVLREIRNARSEQLGRPRGGFGEVAAVLRQRIVERGGQIWPDRAPPNLTLTPDGLTLEGTRALHVRAGVSTLPWPDLALWAGWTTERDLRRRPSLVSVCIVARGTATLGAYAARNSYPDPAFHACVQTDHLMTSDETHGRRVLHLLRRTCDPPQETGEVIAKQALASLREILPGLGAHDVLHVEVSTARGFERIPRQGEPRGRFLERIAHSPLFLASCDQVYPRKPGIEAAVLMAREAAYAVRREI